MVIAQLAKVREEVDEDVASGEWWPGSIPPCRAVSA